MDRNHLERLLREPNNLFGPPKGEGYDYHRAGMTVTALALAALSGWCLFAVVENPALPPLLIGLLLLAGAPFCIGVWFLWPMNLMVGWVIAVAVWYATLRTIAAWVGLRLLQPAVSAAWAITSILGWILGLWLAFFKWL